MRGGKPAVMAPLSEKLSEWAEYKNGICLIPKARTQPDSLSKGSEPCSLWGPEGLHGQGHVEAGPEEQAG